MNYEMSKWVKRNYGWMIVVILGMVPFILMSKLISVDFTQSGKEMFLFSNPDGFKGNQNITPLGFMMHLSGEFALRWFTAVLTCTPFVILFGATKNLFVRQAMGITCFVYSLLHFSVFLIDQGMVATFSEVNYILGLAGLMILLPLAITSNKKSMHHLKATWKKIQKWVYPAFILSILHVALLDKNYMVYLIIVVIGVVLRIPIIRTNVIGFRQRVFR